MSDPPHPAVVPPRPDDASSALDAGWRRPRRETPGGATLAVLLVVLLAVVAGACIATWRMTTGDDAGDPSVPGGTVAAGAMVPPASAVPAPPPVEPVQYLVVTRDDARAINAAKPFSTLPNPAATPLLLHLPADETTRAVDCLAAAAWYEAGDDAAGEQAVVQVVLNRMRHLAFPKTVCGVVFQGAERATGCQFSFTCDGSLRRTPSPAAWLRAQAAAQAGMTGLVFAPVGWATHYHTDWVVPMWNNGVDKIAAVGTHLFFRWPGAQGSAAAFRHAHAGTEPRVPSLARLSPAHRIGGEAADAAVPVLATPNVAADEDVVTAGATPAPAAATALRGNVLQSGGPGGNVHVVAIRAGESGGALAFMALDLCRPAGGRACWVIGFAGRPGQVTREATGRLAWPDRAPDFYYFSDRPRGRETVHWNCTVMPRPNPTQCLPAGFTADQ